MSQACDQHGEAHLEGCCLTLYFDRPISASDLDILRMFFHSVDPEVQVDADPEPQRVLVWHPNCLEKVMTVLEAFYERKWHTPTRIKETPA